MDLAILWSLLRVLVVLILLAGFGWFLLLLARTQRRGPQHSVRHPLRQKLDQIIGDDNHMALRQDLRLKSKLYYYAAHVTDVYDGDTVTVDIDLGMGIWQHNQTVRLWKVNTPEVRGPERPEGLKVRDFVRDLVLDKQILLRTILDKRGEDRTGKFGRLLGEILVENAQGTIVNVNDLLLEQGMAQRMDEGGSVVRAAGTRSAGALPAAIDCPFCGQIRAVDQSTGFVEICPNCLDRSRPITSMTGGLA